MSPERPASDHETLSEIWDEVKKLKVALDEVLYRTASREEHDQKVRAEVLEEAAQEVLKLEKWGPLVPGLEHPFQDSASAIRSLASGAVERGK